MIAPTVCIPNIGPRGRRSRMGFGIVVIVLGGLAAAGLSWASAPRFWRALLFVPFWMGALGVFQAVGQT